MTSAMFYKATNLIKITIEDFTTAVCGPVLLVSWSKDTQCGRAANEARAGARYQVWALRCRAA